MIIEEQNFWFGLIALVFCMVMLILNKNYWNLDWFRIMFKVLAVLCLIFTYANRFVGMFKKEPLIGTLNGILKIDLNRIEIDKQIYNLNEISNLQIEIRNFSGELQSKINYPGPWRSSGVGNSISFLYNGITIKKTFFIQSEQDYERLKEIKKKITNYIV